jgi:putative two-component system response regulator
LHDIGKVGIPDAILLKPGKLTNEEFDIMKTHVDIGAKTLADISRDYPKNRIMEMGIQIAKYHHEKWNGKGYQEGLSGEEIPLSARIMAIVDAYDAIRSKRPYKDSVSHEEAMRRIIQDAGEHFDPYIVKILQTIEHRFVEIYKDKE